MPDQTNDVGREEQGALCFVPIIAEAFGQQNRREALRRAFTRIEELGRASNLRVGLIQFYRFMAEVRAELEVELVVERDGREMGTIAAQFGARMETLSGVTPGNYVLRLATGRVVWEGTLSETQVRVAGAPLVLAADTGAPVRSPATCQESLLDGDAVLYVFPGIESGTIGIEMP